MTEFDIIICGAGPAGSTCAMALANTNLKVAIIDKATFPRNKVCGDAVAAYVPKVLADIHPKFADALQTFSEKTIVNTCRIIAPNGKHIDVASPESGFISKRIDLDHFLFQQAVAEPNITAFTGHEITSVTIDKSASKATVIANNKTFTAKLLIGCDGAHSLTGKLLANNKTDLKNYSGSVRGYYKNVTGFTDKTYELHFFDNILPGYFWIFPLPGNMANVGICIPSSVIAKKNINLRKTMQGIIQQNPAIKQRFENAELMGNIGGYGLPLGMSRKTISGDHFMLCGDAASLIDPATGEGIGQSVISGRYAGWQAIKCFEANDFSHTFIKQYDAAIKKKLHWDFVKSHYTQWWVFNNKYVFNAIFSILNLTKPVRNFLLKKIVST